MKETAFLPPIFRRIALGLLVFLTALSPASAQYDWQSFAGESGGSGSLDGLGNQARFFNPNGVAVDSSGNVYVADTFNNIIRKITPAGLVSTLAGSTGLSGIADGTGTEARFSSPTGLAVDANGIVYVADTNNHTIRKITPEGVVTTLAGFPRQFGSDDGTGSDARFSYPGDVAVSSSGNVYVADTSNQLIRAITPQGLVSTYAGNAGFSGADDGTVSEATFNNPISLAIDSNGTVYVADTNNHTIRKITIAGSVTTLAGSAGNPGSANGTGAAARFFLPNGLTVDASGTVYVADSRNHTLRKITATGVVTTYSGVAGSAGSTDGEVALTQRFNTPNAVAVDTSGTLFVADSANHTIRKITSAGAVTTFAGKAISSGSADGTGSAARFFHPNSTAVDASGTIYVADSDNHTIRKITPNGQVTTWVGSPGISGNTNGSGSAARFNFPYGVTVTASGTVYVADTNNHLIRKITPEGVVTTLAGSAGVSGSTNGTGTSARFNFPNGVAVDGTGTVYVADSSNFTIRKITSAGVVTTLAGSAGNSGSVNGSGSSARFNFPYGLAVDSAGKVYVADGGNHLIRAITSAGAVTTFSGIAEASGSADGTIEDAQFNSPGSVAVDASGSVYVADTNNHTIRKINSLGVVTTLGGLPTVRGDDDGLGTLSRFSAPWGIAVGPDASLYVADYDNNRIVRGIPLSEIQIEQPVGTILVDAAETIDFGGVLLGSSVVKTFTLTNLGSGPLAGISFVKEGPGADQFVINTSQIGTILEPGISNTFTVTFAPTNGTNDRINAVIRIANNDRDESPFDIAVTGLVGFPEIAVEQPLDTSLVDAVSTISFGGISVGTSSQKTFTIRNAGNSNLTGIAVTKDGLANAQYVVSTTGMATTLTPGASTTFTVTFTPTGTTFDARVAAIHIASNDADENRFDIALTGFPLLPEIAVEQPLGTNLVDGTASLSYGGVPLGGSSVKTITIKNPGTGELTGLAVSKTGTASAQYLVDTTGMAATLAAGASTTFTVTLVPTGTSGTRTAAIRIASNDANENPFDINLTGLVFSTVADVDADGLNDWAEYQLSALGFNWQSKQLSLVSALTSGAQAAGLYTDLQLQALYPDATVLTPNPNTQQFKLTLGVKKSTDLQTFTPLPMSVPSTSINGEGNFEFLFNSPEPSAFFRVQAE
jgi:streptogramin lyase